MNNDQFTYASRLPVNYRDSFWLITPEASDVTIKQYNTIDTPQRTSVIGALRLALEAFTKENYILRDHTCILSRKI